jgi:hypothetical protein
MAGAASLLEKAKLQVGRQSHAVCVANVRLALSQLSAAGLDLTVSSSVSSVNPHHRLALDIP